MAITDNFLYTQLFVKLPYPTHSLSGQTVIVTGSNVGLGLEAARHFTRLGAAKVILAVRTVSKGEAAKESIESSTERKGVVEVWQLDLGSYESVKDFARRAEKLDRIDALVENAGIATDKFAMLEDNESSITTNVVSTFLLGLLLLPKLRESGQKFNITPHLVIVCSEVHAWAKFTERTSANIFDTLSNEKTANMPDRYHPSTTTPQQHDPSNRYQISSLKAPRSVPCPRARHSHQTKRQVRRHHQLPQPGPLPFRASSGFRMVPLHHETPPCQNGGTGESHSGACGAGGRGDEWAVSE